MLLTSDELPGAGWVVSRDIAYAVGAGRRKTAEIKRARQSSGITVFRSFRNDNAHLLWTSLTCFASPDDAKSSSLTGLDDAVRNPRPGYSVPSSRRVAQADLPDQLRDMVVSEARFSGPSEYIERTRKARLSWIFVCFPQRVHNEEIRPGSVRDTEAPPSSPMNTSASPSASGSSRRRGSDAKAFWRSEAVP